MTSASIVPPPPSLGSAIHHLRGKWGWIVGLGVLFVIGGIVALGSVVLATVVTVTYVGFMMLFAGIVEIVGAFQMKNWGKFFIWIALGVLYALAGFFTLDNPLLVAGILTLLLGASMIATGLVRIYLAFQMKEGSPWTWVVVSGVITALRRPDDPRALAGLGALRARHLSRRRSDLRRVGLDQRRSGAAQPRRLSAKSDARDRHKTVT